MNPKIFSTIRGIVLKNIINLLIILTQSIGSVNLVRCRFARIYWRVRVSWFFPIGIYQLAAAPPCEIANGRQYRQCE